MEAENLNGWDGDTMEGLAMVGLEGLHSTLVPV